MWCGPAPPGYRGVPCADDEERYWDPKKAPCVPSDCRPQHLFNSRVAAEAVFAALCVEWAHPSPDGFDSGDPDEERYENACVKHKFAVRRLLQEFPEVAPCPLSANASECDTRPCPCGRGVLAKCGRGWCRPNSRGYVIAVSMSAWELNTWRGEWEHAGMQQK